MYDLTKEDLVERLEGALYEIQTLKQALTICGEVLVASGDYMMNNGPLPELAWMQQKEKEIYDLLAPYIEESELRDPDASCEEADLPLGEIPIDEESV